MSERINIGYWGAGLVFAGAIAVAATAHFRFGLNAIATFWIAYILTRPLGASLGDYLSQARHDGGLGLGTTMTSVIFLSAIFATVLFLTITRRDTTPATANAGTDVPRVLVVAHKTATTPALLQEVRDRVARGPARFHLLVPNPAEHAELTEADRQRAHDAGEHVLLLALPLIEEATGREADGSVSIRHDPMDAVEDALASRSFAEIIVSTLPHGVSRWLHADLPHRLSRLGLPVTTVTAREPGEVRRRIAPRRGLPQLRLESR
jgi:hypothetical protein